MTKIFIGRLPESATSEDLRTLFEPFGEINDSAVLPGKGYGFVHMANKADAEDAVVGLKHAKVKGKPINVEFSENRPRRDGKEPRRRENSNSDRSSYSSRQPGGKRRRDNSDGDVDDGPAPNRMRGRNGNPYERFSPSYHGSAAAYPSISEEYFGGGYSEFPGLFGMRPMPRRPMPYLPIGPGGGPNPYAVARMGYMGYNPGMMQPRHMSMMMNMDEYYFGGANNGRNDDGDTDDGNDDFGRIRNRRTYPVAAEKQHANPNHHPITPAMMARRSVRPY